MVEVSVTVKNDERSLTHKYVDYSGNITASVDDPILMQYADEVVKLFGAEPDDVSAKIKIIFR